MIRFDQVTKTYAGTTRPALNSVSLEVLKGEFVFLVGASGSGKSSFLRLVLKEERPTKGQIHVLGQELNTLASRKVPYFRRNLGVVFQDFRLLPNKTVFDNVAFALQVIGKSKGFIQEAVPDVLKMVGLAGKQGRYPHELSGGEQQRVAMARAVVNKPAILLADEPTGNLDPNTSAGIMTLLSAINANGTTVIMATHDVGIVDQMQRRVIELVSGQVVRDERGGSYQTQAVPVVREPAPVAAAAPAPVPVTESTLDDLSYAMPNLTPTPAPAPVARVAEEPPVTGTITVVEPEVTNVRETPIAPRAGAVPGAERPAAEATPLVPPPLNEPREALMHFGLILGEVAQGFRRNLSMVVSVVLVTFISLTFFGAAILLQTQISQTKGYWYDRAQVAIYLCSDIDTQNDCNETAATDAQKSAVQAELEGDTLAPYIKKVDFEDRDQAYKNFLEQFDGTTAAQIVTPDILNESFRVNLIDPNQAEIVIDQIDGMPGVESVSDQRGLLEPIFAIMNAATFTAVCIAGLMLIAAVLLIATTIRLSAFSRRRELGIMRLVGASNRFIETPFILEGVLAALIGSLLAGGLIVVLVQFFVQGYLAQTLTNVALVNLKDALIVVPVLLVSGALLAAVSASVAIRRYLKV